MTNDYKDKLLKYLTGNVEQELSSTTPYYKETSKRINNDIMSIGYNVTHDKGILYCKNSKGEYTGNVLRYGNGSNNNSTWYGYIQLLDSESNVLKTFTSYDTGTKFGIFEVLNIDEQGQVFGIDYSSNKHRLILLNNISEKGNLPDYKCILRQSYFLQGDITSTYINGYESNMLCVEKSKQSSLYFIAGMDGGIDILYATSFRINVGSTNEWIQYDFGVLYQGQFLDSYVYFDVNDNITCNFYFEETNIGNNTHEITRNYNNGTSISEYEVLISNLEQYVPNILGVSGISINQNTLYFGVYGYEVNGANYDNIIRAYKYGNGVEKVFEEIETLSTHILGNRIDFTLVNNQVFLMGIINTYVDSYNKYGDVYVSLISDLNIDYNTKLVDQTYNSEGIFFVSNSFNLYNMQVSYYPVSDNLNSYTYSTKLINRNGYNGEEKEDTNSLLPTQGILFDENNSVIFARDLYNNKTYNNRSISVLNIPNTFLNNVSIEKENLLGATNTTLVENSEEITKNIYEDLYINFNNQITMSNQNTSNYMDNITGAIRLNQSSSKVLDYDNAKATKIRVTYDDDTSYITSASNTIIDDKCTYSIGIHVPNDKNVQSIEIISNDENTTYQTISNLNLENNKYYIITQDVYVV